MAFSQRARRGRRPTVFEHACKLGCEGIIAKRKDLPYQSGRSARSLKIKNPKSPAALRPAHGQTSLDTETEVLTSCLSAESKRAVPWRMTGPNFSSYPSGQCMPQKERFRAAFAAHFTRMQPNSKTDYAKTADTMIEITIMDITERYLKVVKEQRR